MIKKFTHTLLIFISIFNLGLTLSMTFVGCGGESGKANQDDSVGDGTSDDEARGSEGRKPEARKSEDPIDDPMDHPAASIGLRILTAAPAGNVSVSPSADDFLSSSLTSDLDDYTADSFSILIHKKLFLLDLQSDSTSKKKNYFFAWPENSLGSPIASAVFSHRVHRSNGKVIESFQPENVVHDIPNHRWLIPMWKVIAEPEPEKKEDPSASSPKTDPSLILKPAHLNPYTSLDADLDDTQELTVELDLENGKHVAIVIRFQVAGPIPTLILNSEQPSNSLATEHLIRQISKSGEKILVEKIKNPTQRRFHIWVHIDPDEKNYTLDSYISKLHTKEYFDNRPPSVNEREHSYYKSSASLTVNQITIEHSAKNIFPKKETRNWSTRGWEKVTLEPDEEITLTWWAAPRPNTPFCSLPIDDSKNHYMTVDPTQYQLDNMPGIYTGNMRKQIRYNADVDWTFVAGVLNGTLKREIRVTHPFISEEDATQEQSTSVRGTEYRVLKSDLELNQNNSSGISTNITKGNPGIPLSGNYPCQGLFP